MCGESFLLVEEFLPVGQVTPDAHVLSLFRDRLFATIRIIKGGVHDFRGCQIFLIFCRLLLRTNVHSDILSNRK